jgi:signal transduction histidine kinase
MQRDVADVDFFATPNLAQRVQGMAKGAENWARVAEAALDEYVAPLRVLSFAALERDNTDEPFKVLLSHDMPSMRVGKHGPRALIGCFVEAAAEPGRIFVTESIPEYGALACAVLPSALGGQQLIVLSGRMPTLSGDILRQFADQMLELLRPAIGGDSARAPADAVSVAIRRAKREWEMVADSLPAMVGMADGKGQVLRVNRSMSRVPGKELGRSIHSLLHGSCHSPDCRLAQTLSSAYRMLPRERKLKIRTRDLKREGVTWTVYLRYLPVSANRGSRIVFSISDAAEAQAPVAANDGREERTHQELEQLLERHHHLLDNQRRQFAGNLQASVGQALSAARQKIEAALQSLGEGGDRTVIEDLERSISAIDGVLQEAEDCLSNMPTPREFEGEGLAQSLRALCADWQASQSGRDVRIDCVVEDRNVPKSLWLTISRIVHESLHGVASRSPARNIGITLVPGDKALLLAIEHDAGAGAKTAAQFENSSGVQMMRELAEFSGGTFYIDRMADGRTTVEVLWSRPAAFSQLVLVPTPVH